MTQKKKEDLLAALNKNLPKEIDKKNDKIDIINDTEEDYQYAREKLKNLVDQSEEAIVTFFFKFYIIFILLTFF